MRSFFCVSFILILNISFALEWSKNNVIKFGFSDPNSISLFADYESIEVSNFSVYPSSSGGWFYTFPIFVGENYYLQKAFVNLRTEGTTGGVRFRVIDYNTDEIIAERILTNSEVVGLNDKFRKVVYISMDFLDTNVSILSFGLTRNRVDILPFYEIIIEPSLVFYKEKTLLIKFKLGYPSYVDILLFNEKYLVETIAKNTFLKDGSVVFEYDISGSNKKFLITGNYWLYIKATTLENKTQEVIKKFYFVKD